MQNLAIGEILGEKSVAWWARNVTAPRRFIDKPFFTDDQIVESRTQQLAEYEGKLGRTLLMQGKYKKANPVLRRASVVHAKRSQPLINEYYIESLVKSGQLDSAVAEMTLVIKLGKSTKDIDTYYKAYVGGATLKSLKDSVSRDNEMTLSKRLLSEKISEISIQDRDGNPVKLSSFTNKILVIDFWASWCPPCIAGLDAMDDVVEAYKTRTEVAFIFINVGERDKDKALQNAAHFFSGKRSNYTILFDFDHSASAGFNLSVLPTKAVIDNSGMLKFRETGYHGERQQQVDEMISMIKLAQHK
jgi:thiol-disulfide isomerase/thioredoxin